MDIHTQVTRDFLRTVLPPPTRRILEVGCGDGAAAGAMPAASNIASFKAFALMICSGVSTRFVCI